MIIALFEPDIPQNTGSLIRLSACMGVPLHIIEPCGFALDDKRLRRAVMDYGGLAAVTRHRSWQAFLDWRTRAARLVLLTTQAKYGYTDFTFMPDDILLLGRESSGVTDEVREAADARITIPMRPQARSLNVALAAAMVLGEGLRQVGWWSKGVVE